MDNLLKARVWKVWIHSPCEYFSSSMDCHSVRSNLLSSETVVDFYDPETAADNYVIVASRIVEFIPVDAAGDAYSSCHTYHYKDTVLPVLVFIRGDRPESLIFRGHP